MLDEDSIAVMMSVAYAAPYIRVENLTLLSRDDVLTLVEMPMNFALEYVKSNNVKTLASEELLEEAHVLCNDMLLYVGIFNGGVIPSQYIARYRSVCKRRLISIHTHPVPLPIPTLEDIISMYQIGYRVECVLSRLSEDLARMVCIEPEGSLDDVAVNLKKFEEVLYDMVDKYIVVVHGDGVTFIPYPSINVLNSIESEFKRYTKGVARTNIITLDMKNKEYEYYFSY